VSYNWFVVWSKFVVRVTRAFAATFVSMILQKTINNIIHGSGKIRRSCAPKAREKKHIQRYPHSWTLELVFLSILGFCNQSIYGFNVFIEPSFYSESHCNLTLIRTSWISRAMMILKIMALWTEYSYIRIWSWVINERNIIADYDVIAAVWKGFYNLDNNVINIQIFKAGDHGGTGGHVVCRDTSPH
jgi:hypothetical protein